MKLALLSLFFALLAACGVGIHGDPITIDNHSPDASGSNGGGGGNCADPEGPRHNYTTAAEVEAFIVGKWRHCSGPGILHLADETGIELTADHIYYELVGDNLTRVGGFTGQGTWDTYQETPTSVQWDYHPAPNSGNGGYFLFEDSPKRFSIEIPYNPDSSVYIFVE